MRGTGFSGLVVIPVQVVSQDEVLKSAHQV